MTLRRRAKDDRRGRLSYRPETLTSLMNKNSFAAGHRILVFGRMR